MGAAAYLIADRVCMHPDSYTKDGFGFGHEPAICVNNLNDVAAIGHALNEVLAASRKDVRPPDMNKPASERFGFFLKAAKVRSYRELNDKAKHVSIGRDGRTVRFLPSRREKRGFGFLPRDRMISVEAADAAVLGATLLEAFERCE